MNYLKKNIIFLFGVLFYSLIGLYIYFFPLNLEGITISFNSVCCDYGFYKNFHNIFWQDPKNVFLNIFKFWTDSDYIVDDYKIYPGFIYPAVLGFLDFIDNKYIKIIISFSLTFLTLKNISKILDNQKYKNLKLFLIILIPYQMIFTIYFSSEVLFSYFISLYLYEISKKQVLDPFRLFFISVILLFLRPNGIIIALFSLFIFIFGFKKNSYKYSFLMILSIILSLLYYGPYIYLYFQEPPQNFLPEIKNQFSFLINTDSNWISIILLKLFEFPFRIMHSIGIRTITLDYEIIYYFKILFGLIFLLGLIWSVFNFKSKTNMFIIFYFVLSVHGFLVERYFFYLYPILMINFVDFLNKIKVINKKSN